MQHSMPMLEFKANNAQSQQVKITGPKPVLIHNSITNNVPVVVDRLKHVNEEVGIVNIDAMDVQLEKKNKA